LSEDRHGHWRIGRWQVRPELGEITSAGVAKKLDPRTMRLLMFLAERPGEIVTLADLLNGVWGKAVVTQHSVYEAVAALRHALGDAADHPEYIATLPRRGYRLIAAVVPPSVPAEPDASDATLATIVTSGDDPLDTVRGARLVPVALLSLALVLTAVVGVTWFSHTPPASQERASIEKSIAVLPFVDFSEKKDQEYLADGLAEELLDVLANLPGLRVIARTSSFQFKNKNEDVRDIGAQLGVSYVVEGSIRRFGDRVRVAAQLIRTSDGSHQWSGTFDHDVGDTLQLQSRIAAPLGRALELSVATAAANRMATTNAEAHDHYLQGLHALDTYSLAGTEAAANEFQAAIALDPKFTAAHVSLAMAYYVQSAFGFVPPEVGFPLVRQEALQALSLNPRSAVAHALLARVATLYSWDWAEARKQSQAALALAPQNAFVLYAAADLASILGDFDRSEQLFRASLVSDPLNPEAHFMLGLVLLAEGRAHEAEAEARRCLTINPTYAYGHYAVAYTLIMQDNDVEMALDECELETAEGGRLNCLAIVYARLGRLDDSNVALDQSIHTRGDSAAFGVARVLAYRGEHERAFEWLSRAYEQRDPVLPYIKGDPNFERLRGDLRYTTLLRKLKLEGAASGE
jgi:TolB-like protein/DNA-binding winged helix-turn-helix (wHTH) protein